MGRRVRFVDRRRRLGLGLVALRLVVVLDMLGLSDLVGEGVLDRFQGLDR